MFLFWKFGGVAHRHNAIHICLIQRHFCVFALSFPGKESVKTIYSSILNQHLKINKFSMAVQKASGNLVEMALALHQKITQSFLPTAIKFHYVFNLRDLSNIFQVCYMGTLYVRLWQVCWWVFQNGGKIHLRLILLFSLDCVHFLTCSQSKSLINIHYFPTLTQSVCLRWPPKGLSDTTGAVCNTVWEPPYESNPLEVWFGMI